LNAAGADPSVQMNGVFDAATKQAVIEFQKSHDLEPDGDVGPKTWGMLDAIGRDRVASKEEMAEIRAKMTAADKAFEAGDYVGSAALSLAVYKMPTMVPGVRNQVAWSLGACEHPLGTFDAAISWYQESLDSPGIAAMGRRDGVERIRQARLKQ